MKKIFTIFLIFAFVNLWFSPYKVCCKKIIAQNQATPENILIPESQVFVAGSVAAGETIAAFTLAEVVITMTIIGVVAVLVVPPLVVNLRNTQLKTAWKKKYSEVSAALNNLKADYGGSFMGLFNNEAAVRDKLSNYLNYAKLCNDSGAEGCWHKNNKWFFLSDGGAINGFSDAPGMVLADGTLLIFESVHTSINCTATAAKYSPSDECANVAVDVNGFKEPNTIGIDIFYVIAYESGVKPWGLPGDRAYDSSFPNMCKIPQDNRGWGCSALYLMQ